MMHSLDGASNGGITPFYAKIKRHWRQKHYERLRDAEIRDRKKARTRRFGGYRKKKKNWLIKVVPKLRIKFILVSPLMKLLSKIRDGYINMMLRLAGNVGSSSFHDGTMNGFVAKRIPPQARGVVVGKKSRSRKEYDVDSRLILQIYKVLMASSREQLASDIVGNNSSHHQQENCY